MTFTVTYRGADGALVTEAVEATNRTECFAQMKAQGIVPLSVKEGDSVSRRGRGDRRDERGKNGRAESRRRKTCRDGTGKKPFTVICYLFAAIAVIAAIALWWWFGRGIEAAPQDDGLKRPSGLVKEVTPAAAPPAAAPVATNVVRVTAKGTRIPDNVQPDEFGVLRHPGGLRWVDTNDLHIVKHPRKKRLFKHHSENSIATLLTLDPEKMAPFLVGRRPKFGQRFVDDFKASLYEEVEFPEDDTEEEREVRKAVVEVKKEMAAALERGEDIAKMMNDAQEELDRLVSYRDTLVKQLKTVKLDEKFSDADVEDFTAAANQMLKEQGLKELRMPNLTYRQFMLQRRRERAAAEAQQGADNQQTKETK